MYSWYYGIDGFVAKRWQNGGLIWRLILASIIPSRRVSRGKVILLALIPSRRLRHQLTLRFVRS